MLSQVGVCETPTKHLPNTYQNPHLNVRRDGNQRIINKVNTNYQEFSRNGWCSKTMSFFKLVGVR